MSELGIVTYWPWSKSCRIAILKKMGNEMWELIMHAGLDKERSVGF